MELLIATLFFFTSVLTSFSRQTVTYTVRLLRDWQLHWSHFPSAPFSFTVTYTRSRQLHHTSTHVSQSSTWLCYYLRYRFRSGPPPPPSHICTFIQNGEVKGWTGCVKRERDLFHIKAVKEFTLQKDLFTHQIRMLKGPCGFVMCALSVSHQTTPHIVHILEVIPFPIFSPILKKSPSWCILHKTALKKILPQYVKVILWHFLINCFIQCFSPQQIVHILEVKTNDLNTFVLIKHLQSSFKRIFKVVYIVHFVACCDHQLFMSRNSETGVTLCIMWPVCPSTCTVQTKQKPTLKRHCSTTLLVVKNSTGYH